MGNNLTYTYPWEKEVLIEEIKKELAASEKMMNIYENIKKKIKPYLK